ncbi:MAG: hypothetical protein WA876_16360 [Candidatus Acidiferrales bacterium]
MNCTDFKNIVHELARDDAREILGEAVTVMARFHAETCEPCAARLAEARSLAQALKDAAEDSTQWGAPVQLEASLTSAFREYHRGLERSRYRARQSRLRWAEWMALGVAAAVLLAVGAWNFSRGRASATKTNPGTVVVNSATSNAANVNGVTPQAAPVETAAAEDSVSDFVPVPYGEGLSPDDSGLVVRVTMTRSALGSLGYPVDEMHAGDMIQADLLVGEDGWPRAVRLVQ